VLDDWKKLDEEDYQSYKEKANKIIDNTTSIKYIENMKSRMAMLNKGISADIRKIVSIIYMNNQQNIFK